MIESILCPAKDRDVPDGSAVGADRPRHPARRQEPQHWLHGDVVEGVNRETISSADPPDDAPSAWSYDYRGGVGFIHLPAKVRVARRWLKFGVHLSS